MYDANNPSNLKLIYQTEEQYQNIFTDKNSFDYSLNYWFQVDNSYKMVFSYTTQNLFQKDEEYIFNVISAGIDPLNIIVEAYTDEENGRIKLSLNRPSSMGSFTGQIIIKRTSNKSNYTKWEDMYTTNYQNVTGISYDWYDYTIENGIWYVYAIQGVDEDGLYTPISVLNDPVMLSFEYIFLTSKNKQLKIAYNPSISSFKHTLSESRQDTIGGKYPFIKRNGYIDYVQFPLGGMIYSAMDENGTLTTKEEVFGKWIDFYTAYNEINNIPTWNDLIWEKNFRDKVIDFLYDDSAKLFRSPTEGNYLIKLMDIQFQPNQALGRQLWSFTANAFEIDECNIQNYEKYNIVEVNDGNTFIGNGTDAVFPITRIFYVQSQEEFPVEGVLGCLYIYDKQIYLWNNNSHNYELISVPTWNGTTDFNSLSGTNGQLYTNGIDLYTWNSNTFSFDGISVPRYNNSLQGEIDPPSSL